MKVLLVHNEFHLTNPITWLSFGIRVVTCSKWNHVALEIDGKIIEAVGKGVISTPKEVWLDTSDRIVKPLIMPENAFIEDEAIREVIGMCYGFGDLLGILNHIIQTKWLGKNPEVGKDYDGIVCSVLAGYLLGMNLPYVTPADFDYMGFISEPEYRTIKKKRK